MSLRVLLLQARRPDDPMQRHEHECFAARTGLDVDRIHCHDLCQGPPRLAEVRDHDALMVGGSGDYYVSRGNLPRFDETLDLMREVVATGLPTFASCFGYQCMVRALGGQIVNDPERTEVGSFELTLGPEGRRDELFSRLPDRFWAQMGHQDRASSHPAGVPNLASSERSPNQALRIPGQPVWASQFHPELDRKTNLDRFMAYIEGYAKVMSERERQDAIDGFKESNEASSLLPAFLKLVFDYPPD